jgi:hypothetical protein
MKEFFVGEYTVSKRGDQQLQHNRELTEILKSSPVLPLVLCQMLEQDQGQAVVVVKILRDDLWHRGGFSPTDRYGVFIEMEESDARIHPGFE